MKIIPLSEGTFTVDKTKRFIPFDASQDQLQNRPTGSLLVEVQPFVVITSGDILLLDTGLGFKINDSLQLHQNLMNNHINPSDITKVLLTHLHKDHAGGISYENPTHPIRQLSFPRAQYYIQKREFEFAFKKGFPSFIIDELEILKQSSPITWMQDDKGAIDDFISYEVTWAHSPYHQVFFIRDKEEIIFFGGDDAPQLQQMKHRFIAKYDYDGKKAMELRSKWWLQGQQEKWKFLFYHDVKNAVYNNE
jgi:glyoxylase-like metal-dependent hydrolase (beta-lactamase superfamily II)